MRGESGEFGQEQHHPLDINNVTQHAVPGRLDARVHHSETDSRTSTVTNLPSTFTRSSAAASDVTFTQFPTIQVRRGIAVACMLPGTLWHWQDQLLVVAQEQVVVTLGRCVCGFEQRLRRRWRRGRRRKRHVFIGSGLRRMKTIAWKEDVAVYGNLASK